MGKNRGEGEQKVPRGVYEAELFRLQAELVKVQEWVAPRGAGRRDLRGPRRGRQGRHHHPDHPVPQPAGRAIVALPAPTERERSQWYFQRYIEQLPGAGEIVLLDRSGTTGPGSSG